jgi:hypothetical protein
MLWEPQNLASVLLKNRNKTIPENRLMAQVKALLNNDETQHGAIKSRLENGNGADANAFVFDLLDSHRIFHISHIQKLCIDYRLRFLNASYFKQGIPEEAVSQIRQLENIHGTILDGFRIVAPSKAFSLKNYDDPLLFAPMGNGYYYLVHKWGNDINPMRRALVLPLRDLGSLLVLLVVASALFTFAITQLFFTGEKTGQFVLLAFLFTFKAFCGIALYYCFWKGKNVNTAIWDSEFSNRY